MNGEIPVGGIISWAKSVAGVPQTLPYGWALADGSTLSDAQSIFNGLALPNLTDKFLRGSSTSGGTGGTETHSHSVNLNDATTAVGLGAADTSVVPLGTYNTAASSSLPSYYQVVFIIRIK